MTLTAEDLPFLDRCEGCDRAFVAGDAAAYVRAGRAGCPPGLSRLVHEACAERVARRDEKGFADIERAIATAERRRLRTLAQREIHRLAGAQEAGARALYVVLFSRGRTP